MRLKVGIIGVGNIGKIHYHIYKQINKIEKIYLVDLDPHKLSSFNETCSNDYRKLLGCVDCVSIASSTASHHEVARFFLEHHIPVLVEKPLASRLSDARRLIELARRKKTLLFVGHVERYNNAYLAVKKIVRNPVFIECHRLNPYPYRSLDTSVVLDLMIHDLDIILGIAKDDVAKIEAKGVKVLSPTEDIANARITFKKGCVANVTSSRISAKRERKIRIFMKHCYISLDYALQTVEIYQKAKNHINKKTLPINKEQPLEKEIKEFIRLVERKAFTMLHAQSAYEALRLSLRIQKKI